jgi:hypothetical protein
MRWQQHITCSQPWCWGGYTLAFWLQACSMKLAAHAQAPYCDRYCNCKVQC